MGHLTPETDSSMLSDQLIAQSYNQSSKQSITEQSDDSIRRKSLLYSKNLPFSIILLDPITCM
jgi:hypothetical protein